MKKKNNKEKKELIIIITSLYYLTIFLEKQEVVNDDGFVKDIDKNKEEDIAGAFVLGKQMIRVIKNIKSDYQGKILEDAQRVFDRCEQNKDMEFNYLTFVLTLLMRYKEEFKNKRYNITTTYGQLNDTFDAYFKLALKDKEQMEVVNDSIKVADEFFEETMKYEK